MKQQVLVIHGGTAFASYEQYLDYLTKKEITLERLLSKRWKEMLQEKLGSDYQVFTPTMPNGSNVHYIEWKIMFEKILPLLDDSLILIGHSLGGIFLMKYLSENTTTKTITKLIVVAPPFDNASGEDLQEFALNKEVLRTLHTRVGKIVLYQSKDDVVVPPENAEHYKDFIEGLELKMFEDRGHFTTENFPEIVEEVKG